MQRDHSRELEVRPKTRRPAGLPDDAQEDLEGWAAGNVPATDARHGGHVEAPWVAPAAANMATFAHILHAIKQLQAIK